MLQTIDYIQENPFLAEKCILEKSLVSSKPCQRVVEVLIYDLNQDDQTQPGYFDWYTEDYPYIPDALVTLDLGTILGGGPYRPTAVDAELVQDPPLTGPYYSRAFIINKATDSFFAINVNGTSSQYVTNSHTPFDPGSNPGAVAVKSDGKEVYFTCNSDNPDDDKVKYASTTTFSVDDVKDPVTGNPTVISDPIDIALDAIQGKDADYYLSIIRLIRSLSDSAFVAPASTSRQELIAQVQIIYNGYDVTTTKTAADVLTAREMVQLKITEAFYEDIIVERLDTGLLHLIDQYVTCKDPIKYTNMLITIIEGVPDSLWSGQQQTAEDKAQEAADEIQAGQWDVAIERMNELKDIIRQNMTDVRIYRLLMDFVDETIECLSGIKGKFDQSASISQAMENEVSGLPDTSFVNHGGKVSLLEHIEQLTDRLEDYHLEQALQKANQVLTEIPAKVTDPEAQTSLIEKDQQIIGLLEQIGQ